MIKKFKSLPLRLKFILVPIAFFCVYEPLSLLFALIGINFFVNTIPPDARAQMHLTAIDMGFWTWDKVLFVVCITLVIRMIFLWRTFFAETKKQRYLFIFIVVFTFLPTGYLTVYFVMQFFIQLINPVTHIF